MHGSAIFTAARRSRCHRHARHLADEQRVDGLIEEYSKKFMLDYNFPPFSVGEVQPIRGPGRREIGHGCSPSGRVKAGAAADDEFPYTIRVISDILESNGSSSMASVCGGDAGPDGRRRADHSRSPGISIGLVKEERQVRSCSPTSMGDEDHFGDMDFKVAGTQTASPASNSTSRSTASATRSSARPWTRRRKPASRS